MPHSRRNVLGAAAGGLAAGLAGCTGVLSGGGSGASSDTLDLALLAEPNLQSIASESTWEEQFSRVYLDYVDCSSLRDVDGPIADWAATTGLLAEFRGVSTDDGVDSIDATAIGRYHTAFEEGQLLVGNSGYAAGSIDVEAFRDANIEWDAEGRLDGHDVYPVVRHNKLGISDAGVATSQATSYVDADLEEAPETTYDEFATGLLERSIARSEDSPDTPEWVTDALERVSPYQYANHTLQLTAGSGSDQIFTTGYDVRDEETRVGVVIGAPTTETFESVWDRESVEREFRGWQDLSPSFDVGDRIGVATATVATSETLLAEERFVG